MVVFNAMEEFTPANVLVRNISIVDGRMGAMDGNMFLNQEADTKRTIKEKQAQFKIL